jgi:hypothetical protein
VTESESAPESAAESASEPVAQNLTDPIAQEAATEPEPAPSPFAALSTQARSVLGASLDLATRSAADLRAASLYIGLLVLGTAGPFALLLWGTTEVEYFRTSPPPSDQADNLETWLGITGFLAVVGFIVAAIESRGVATALLAARLQQRPLSVRDAVRRSRLVFWRLIGVTIVVQGPLLILQTIVGDRLAEAFRGQSEVSEVTATLITAVIGTPFAYATAGIVLGDVGPVESAKRSIRLFSAARRSALVVSIIGVVAQFITLAGLLAAIDLLARVFEALGLGPDSGTIGIAVITVIVIAAVFALGSLTFTVGALALAPEVVMFTALTHAAPGLDTVRPPAEPLYPGHAWPPPFRWITRPLLATMAMGGVALALGLATLAR